MYAQCPLRIQAKAVAEGCFQRPATSPSPPKPPRQLPSPRKRRSRRRPREKAGPKNRFIHPEYRGRQWAANCGGVAAVAASVPEEALQGPCRPKPEPQPRVPLVSHPPSARSGSGAAAMAGPLARAAGGAGVHFFVALALELLVEDAGCEGSRKLALQSECETRSPW